MVNTTELKQLRETRNFAHAKAMEILRITNPTAEHRATFDKAMADVNRLNAEIKSKEGRGRNEFATYDAGDSKRDFAFGRWMRYGAENITPEEKRSLEFRDVVEGAPMLTHIGTYTGLGYLVPTGFTDKIENAMKYYCQFLDSDASGVTLLSTDTGQPLPMPTSNDTTQVATIVGESSQVSEDDITASQINFAAYKFTSGVVKASIELLQDSGIDIDAWFADRFAIRFGRGIEAYLTTGTGSSQPTGILTAIEACGVSPIIATGASSNTGNAGQTYTNSIGSIDLVNLEHGVDPSYRRNARYMFNDTTLGSLQSLLDKYGRPLWTPSMSDNVPDKINGYPYVINQSMPAISAASNPVVFGDFSKFIVRKVKGFSVQRLTELYATTGQVGFVSFARLDSNLLDAGTHPLNILEMHS
jgi:HK97 family phage major capsid protein